MLSLIIGSLILLGYIVGLFMIFPKAGRKSWEALVPFYNFFVLTKIIQRPWWWVLLLIFPGVNILMLMIMNVSLARMLGRHSVTEVLSALFLPFVYFGWLAQQEGVQVVGKTDWSDKKQREQRKKADLVIFAICTLGIGLIRPVYAAVFGAEEKPNKPTFTKEWSDAILFAVVAASIIRTYFFEAFTIPTSSMEKTLLIGDYLFVSKLAYGPKVPQTPLSFPFAHHSLPGTTTKSYLEWITLPYFRLPGFGEVERNDIVVFNYPEGDTVLIQFQSNKSYNQFVREQAAAMKNADLQRGGTPRSDEAYDKLVRKLTKEQMDYTVRPVDKRENYIKRCVAVPGDKIQVVNGKLMINEEAAYIPPEFQYRYVIKSKSFLNKKILKEKLNVNLEDIRFQQSGDAYYYNLPLTLEAYESVKNMSSIEQIEPDINLPGEYPATHIFPNDPKIRWTEDMWGPLTAPTAGTTVELNSKTLPFYERIITVYEGHSLRVDGETIYVDGEAAEQYTFAMNYYFLMGDNRHNSADSRFWGFVPEDHIVGEAALVWMSLDKELGWFDGKVRWDRLFMIPE